MVTYTEYRILPAIALPDNIGFHRIMEEIGMTYIKTYLHNDPLFKAGVVLYQVPKKVN